jgi:hypothetical protein|nr:MAG TPA: tail repeat-like protein [Caudoviricetes sp.]
MEPKYKINPLTGELQEYVFEYNGILVLRNFTAQVDNDRLVVRSASDVNFSILEALVSEVEIDGVLYDNPTAAKEALQRLVFNKNVPVILPEEERKKISSALQSGGYSGTAQDLKKLIDGINAILQSDDTDLDQLQEIVAYIKQNKKILSTLGISNIAGLTDALAEKANKIHKHSWGDIEGSPADLSEALKKAIGNLQIGGRNYLLNSKQTLITSSASAITGVIGMSPDFKKILNEQPTLPIVVSCYIRYKNITSTEPKSRLGFEGAISFTDDTSQYFNYWLNVSADDIGKSIKGQRFYSVFTLLPNKTIKDVVVSGIFSQITAEEVEISNPKIEFGDIPTDWSPAPEDLALYEDLIKVGSLITGNVSLNKNHRNLIFFVTANANIDVKGLGDLGSSSFRKVFNEGVVTFTCESKNIIYTGDNTFNGKKGSTAVVSIYDNDCYIDIRNI